MRPVRVALVAASTPEVVAALGPGALVWGMLHYVDEVVFAADGAVAQDGLTSVAFPVLEGDARRCRPDGVSLFPDSAAIDILASKAAFADHVARLGLAGLCPEGFADAAQARFPCVVKRCDLSAGQGVAVARSRAELDEILARAPWCGRDVVLQEFIEGVEERTSHCVCQGGRIVFHVSFGFEVAGPDCVRTPGNVRATRLVRASAAHVAAFEALLRPLGYDGVCNIDHKLTPDGRLKIFEINPRVGGSLLRDYSLRHRAALLACLLETAVLGAPQVSLRRVLYGIRSRVERWRDAVRWRRGVWGRALGG